jgi:hypothetical protein
VGINKCQHETGWILFLFSEEFSPREEKKSLKIPKGFVLLLSAITLFVLRFKASDYPFGIFKLFFSSLGLNSSENKNKMRTPELKALFENEER